jgi:hypothetical protein
MVFLDGRSPSALASEANHKDAVNLLAFHSTKYIDYWLLALFVNNRAITYFLERGIVN